MRLSLRWKIVGGFGLLLGLIALLGWVTLSLFSSLRSVQREVFDDAVPGVVEVDEIVRSFTAQNAALQGYLIQGDVSLLGQYRAEVERAKVAIRQSRSLFTTQEELDLLDELTAAGERFQNLVEERVIPRVEAGERSLAFRILGQEGTSQLALIESLGSRLREQQDETLTVTEDELRRRNNQSLVLLVAIILGAFAAGLVLAIVLPRRLSANISALVEAARGIGRGDLDQRIEINSRDEVEELAQRFTEMQAGLKRLQQLALQDRELAIAGSIQQNLLQRNLPDIPGVALFPIQRQANLVGGDWYDVDVIGSSLTVAVGDASGKGIGAALMATVALSVLRAERGLGATPKRIIERANEALREATEPDSFTTLVYATIDFNTGEASWLNMGHPSPFILTSPLRDPEVGQIRPRGYYLEGPRNRVLGWFDDPGMAETVIRLEPGDRLVFYTDGFLEAKSPQGEVWGDHRLAGALTRLAPLDSAVIGEELVRDVEGFAAGKLDDDLTMLIVEFQGSALREAAAGGRTDVQESG
jgi:serine phosphatase RsbU (regulator of sigma subunit)/CHASE3 domain sensor protein